MIKEINLQALKKNAKYAPTFKDSLIVLEMSDYDIETEVQIWNTIEENYLVHDSMVKSVIYVMDKSTEEEYEEKSESQEVELADECAVNVSLKTSNEGYVEAIYYIRVCIEEKLLPPKVKYLFLPYNTRYRSDFSNAILVCVS